MHLPRLDLDNHRDIAERIRAERGDALRAITVKPDGIEAEIAAGAVVDLVTFLRDDGYCLFQTLVDVTAVDWPERERRFDVVWHLLSMRLNARIRLKAQVAEGEKVPSITSVHPSAGWFEREVYDMFGIFFSGHPDLRRILTDYGFSGFPLRKDFPTTGYVEVRYDEEEKRVIYEPVSLTQEFRQFDFLSPWEGARYVMDEAGKAAEGEG